MFPVTWFWPDTVEEQMKFLCFSHAPHSHWAWVLSLTEILADETKWTQSEWGGFNVTELSEPGARDTAALEISYVLFYCDLDRTGLFLLSDRPIKYQPLAMNFRNMSNNFRII